MAAAADELDELKEIPAFGADATYPLWLVVYCIHNLFIFQILCIGNSIDPVVCERPDIVKVHQQKRLAASRDLRQRQRYVLLSTYILTAGNKERARTRLVAA